MLRSDQNTVQCVFSLKALENLILCVALLFQSLVIEERPYAVEENETVKEIIAKSYQLRKQLPPLTALPKFLLHENMVCIMIYQCLDLG